mmetsp:Transcript_10524/g.22950  ORF Transcript_10524/g.22950 Transcript_10524/m.22950 type:complete len:284 (+) Transcript_10524:196-1047(+)
MSTEGPPRVVNTKKQNSQRGMMLDYFTLCRARRTSQIRKMTIRHDVSFSAYNLLAACLLIGNYLLVRVHGFSPPSMSRSSFLEHFTSNTIGAIATTTATTSVLLPTISNAIEFVPASPNFSGTYQDAVEIMYAQRLAVDNIANVIDDGNIDEAGFKVMQLNAQTRMAGKIILDTFQENLGGSVSKGGGRSGANGSDDSIMLLRFLSCQKKFATLLDLCDDCSVSLQSVLKEKDNGGGGSVVVVVGAKAAVQKIKVLGVVEETKSAYDDFLGDLKSFEEESVEK